jgi:hypothetical protein
MKKKAKEKAEIRYTKGQINVIIDSLIHPFFKKNQSFRLVDGFLHGVVEQDLELSFRKFVKFNALSILAKIEIRSFKKRKKGLKQN